MVPLTLAITGSGGAGAISSGEMLLTAAARHGYFGMLKKTFSPQIRGGESAAILRLGDKPVGTFSGQVDILVALDWENFARFTDEIPLGADTLVLQTKEAGDPPEPLGEHPLLFTVDAAALAQAADSTWLNLVFVGLLGAGLRCPREGLLAVVRERLSKHGTGLVEAACRAVDAGYAEKPPDALRERLRSLACARDGGSGHLLASGNQMAALGALDAGVRFVAAYPITPASDLLEFLAHHIEALGGHLVQAEDELAAINMTIGAGFGGVPALTATSGPGLALMSEGMGLAVASETPAVVIDVMRGGPSTGIPTKSEQGDFNIAVHGLHGDAPHVVLACNSIADCYFTAAWAVALAQGLQTLVVVLSDQFLGQSMQIIEEPASPPPQAELLRAGHAAGAGQPYWRYRDTENGISPMALPGDEGCMYTADGLEHREDAVPSPTAHAHGQQLDKRLRKLEQHDYGEAWADLHGSCEGNPLVICWGGSTASVLEAREQAAAQGRELCVLSLRLLAPLQRDKLEGLLRTAASILVVEQNHGAQCCHYLRGELPGFDYRSLARPGPRLLTAADILAALED